MKSAERIIRVTDYTSEVLPFVTTTNPALAAVIEWADANPVVWRIVTSTRSKSFGKNSSVYMGCSRGSEPGQILDRVATFKHEVQRVAPPGQTYGNEFWRWRANFTLEHYDDKGFKGGFFQQYDGGYDRGCCYLDYTPKTLEAVIDRFVAWCAGAAAVSWHPTVEVRIDGKCVRRIK
jgi:hypothetical protein